MSRLSRGLIGFLGFLLACGGLAWGVAEWSRHAVLHWQSASGAVSMVLIGALLIDYRYAVQPLRAVVDGATRLLTRTPPKGDQ